MKNLSEVIAWLRDDYAQSLNSQRAELAASLIEQAIAHDGPPLELKSTELDILRCFVRGLSYVGVANAVSLSLKESEARLHKARDRNHATTLQLVYRAAKEGLL